MKLENTEQSSLNEIEKDVNRLERVAERFSKVGSEPALEATDIYQSLNNGIDYIKARSSKRIKFITTLENKAEIRIPLNENLFEWVIENICKNAIDSMNGEGKIEVSLANNVDNVTIDISDTGRGIPKSKHKTIFQPGYTTKKRGWRLGLSLSKRIIEDYHKGRIFVKNSDAINGTTFRIILKK